MSTCAQTGQSLVILYILKQIELFYVFDALVNMKKISGGGHIIRVTGKIKY